MGSTFVLGERRLSGEHGRVIVLGSVEASDGGFRSAWIMGESALSRVKVQKTLRCMGELTGDTVQIHRGSVMGEVRLKGLCSADRLSVTGDLQAEYLRCRLLRCAPIHGSGSKPAWSGVLEGTTLEIQEEIALDFEHRFQNILASAPLRAAEEISCENLYCFGGLAAGSVNADHICIVLTGGGAPLTAEHLAGGRIRIVKSFRPDRELEAIPAQTRYPALQCEEKVLFQADTVEGDVVEMESARVGTVSGGRIKIGPLSVVDRVEYTQSIEISPKAAVGEVIAL